MTLRELLDAIYQAVTVFFSHLGTFLRDFFSAFFNPSSWLDTHIAIVITVLITYGLICRWIWYWPTIRVLWDAEFREIQVRNRDLERLQQQETESIDELERLRKIALEAERRAENAKLWSGETSAKTQKY